jgi:NAD(P)-dependent dehydrogenase (short-subunit alcohol dehydrogenase family)
VKLHPAFTPGRTAVVTGAASGVGLACATAFAGLGLNVLMADYEAAALDAAAEHLEDVSGVRIERMVVDVCDYAQVEALKARAFESFGDVAVLMNNAGVGSGGGPFDNIDGWRRVLNTNLWGVIHGVQAFTQAMIDQGRPAAIVNTGSKQGITTPPGDTAYNVSKAGIKVLTEGLAHSLRNIEGCAVTAHLLVPGFTFTGMTRRRMAEKPPAAWTAEQVADFMLERTGEGDFYILCPDNDVTREMDNARIAWAAGDLTENRPALSRWHPDYADAFAAWMAEKAPRRG